jgi:hypothetical protein
LKPTGAASLPFLSGPHFQKLLETPDSSIDRAAASARAGGQPCNQMLPDGISEAMASLVFQSPRLLGLLGVC